MQTNIETRIEEIKEKCNEYCKKNTDVKISDISYKEKGDIIVVTLQSLKQNDGEILQVIDSVGRNTTDRTVRTFGYLHFEITKTSLVPS